jgi:hypothetical protein
VQVCGSVKRLAADSPLAKIKRAPGSLEHLRAGTHGRDYDREEVSVISGASSELESVLFWVSMRGVNNETADGNVDYSQAFGAVPTIDLGQPLSHPSWNFIPLNLFDDGLSHTA